MLSRYKRSQVPPDRSNTAASRTSNRSANGLTRCRRRQLAARVTAPYGSIYPRGAYTVTLLTAHGERHTAAPPECTEAKPICGSFSSVLALSRALREDTQGAIGSSLPHLGLGWGKPTELDGAAVHALATSAKGGVGSLHNFQCTRKRALLLSAKLGKSRCKTEETWAAVFHQHLSVCAAALAESAQLGGARDVGRRLEDSRSAGAEQVCLQSAELMKRL